MLQKTYLDKNSSNTNWPMILNLRFPFIIESKLPKEKSCLT